MSAIGMTVNYKSGTMVTDRQGVVEKVEYKNGRPSFFVRWADGQAGWFAASNVQF